MKWFVGVSKLYIDLASYCPFAALSSGRVCGLCRHANCTNSLIGIFLSSWAEFNVVRVFNFY